MQPINVALPLPRSRILVNERLNLLDFVDDSNHKKNGGSTLWSRKYSKRRQDRRWGGLQAAGGNTSNCLEEGGYQALLVARLLMGMCDL